MFSDFILSISDFLTDCVFFFLFYFIISIYGSAHSIDCKEDDRIIYNVNGNGDSNCEGWHRIEKLATWPKDSIFSLGRIDSRTLVQSLSVI